MDVEKVVSKVFFNFLSYVTFGLTFVLSANVNYIIDEFDEIYLPFAMESCQHHSPIGTYVEYQCGNSSNIVWKQFWEDEICPGNWSSRAMITDTNAQASTSASSENVAATSDADSLYCLGVNNRVTIAAYCDFEVPAQRELDLAPNVCVDIIGDSTVYLLLECNKETDDTYAYFWKNNNDCSSGKKHASYKRTLSVDECNVFLNDSETGLGYTIYAESISCTEEAKGASLNCNIMLFGIIAIIGIFIN